VSKSCRARHCRARHCNLFWQGQRQAVGVGGWSEAGRHEFPPCHDEKDDRQAIRAPTVVAEGVLPDLPMP
jgi:hypothetical protein